MKISSLILLLPIMILSCVNNQDQKEFKRLKIWEEIRIAVKENRIDYLLKVSKDTLKCIECKDGESFIAKEAFFDAYINQIETSDMKEYSVYCEEYKEVKGFDTRYRINYSYDENGKKYNSIYTILTGADKVQFQGVFGIP